MAFLKYLPNKNHCALHGFRDIERDSFNIQPSRNYHCCTQKVTTQCCRGINILKTSKRCVLWDGRINIIRSVSALLVSLNMRFIMYEDVFARGFFHKTNHYETNLNTKWVYPTKENANMHRLFRTYCQQGAI